MKLGKICDGMGCWTDGKQWTEPPKPFIGFGWEGCSSCAFSPYMILCCGAITFIKIKWCSDCLVPGQQRDCTKKFPFFLVEYVDKLSFYMNLAWTNLSRWPTHSPKFWYGVDFFVVLYCTFWQCHIIRQTISHMWDIPSIF